MAKDVIASIFEPTLKLQELKVKDFSYDSLGTGNPPKQMVKDIEYRTVEYPHLEINDYLFNDKEILNMVIRSENFLPSITVDVRLDVSGTFLSFSFPKDGDILSIFIRGRDDLFKPIRNDYMITNVVSYPSGEETSEGKFNELHIEGELYIPHMYDENCYANSGTSMEVLKEIAKNLQLGFATNEENTDDSMTWISANGTYYDYISHISGACWKDEESFFVCFVDIYYHLNFVNVNSLINYDAKLLDQLVEDPQSSAMMNDEKVQKGIAKKYLTNNIKDKRTSFYIVRFNPVNNSSGLVKVYGYAFNATFFEQNSLKPWQLQAKSLVTKGAEKNKIILRGRPGDATYDQLQKYNFIGIQYSKPEHNVHEKFLFARVHNMMNNVEMSKLNLEVDLNKFNLNLYRYENIPAVFTVTGDETRIRRLNENMNTGNNSVIGDPMGVTGGPNDLPAAIAIDKFYTGFYLIKGFTISFSLAVKPYSQSNFTQTLTLARREWPSPTDA